MRPRHSGTINESGVDAQRSTQASVVGRSSADDLAAISELAALIEQAMAASDALGLTFVSIDLCSALARLQAIGMPAHPEAVSAGQEGAATDRRP